MKWETIIRACGVLTPLFGICQPALSASPVEVPGSSYGSMEFRSTSQSGLDANSTMSDSIKYIQVLYARLSNETGVVKDNIATAVAANGVLRQPR